jgi:hypothetical protein
LFFVFLVSLCLCGSIYYFSCQGQPSAPVLSDDPVYQNNREGFRFLAPEGWSQNSRSDVPPGKVTKERLLVSYRRPTGPSSATLRVSLADLPDSVDLAAFLAEPSFAVEKWELTGPGEQIQAGKAPGVRYDFKGFIKKQEMAKEVVAVRRGERVYFFTALYAPEDIEVRDELRKVVASIKWR